MDKAGGEGTEIQRGQAGWGGERVGDGSRGLTRIAPSGSTPVKETRTRIKGYAIKSSVGSVRTQRCKYLFTHHVIGLCNSLLQEVDGI